MRPMPIQPELVIHDWPLPWVARLEQREPATIERVVLHCTELPDLATAREYGERLRYDSGTGNSGHYYIDRDGQVHRFVPIERIAHHVRGYNAHSIGIELVNLGRWPDWLNSRHQVMTQPYPAVQIDVLIRLLQQLVTDLPTLQWISGHEDLDREQVPASDDPATMVARKRDPGPCFPWQRVLAATQLQRETVAPS